MAQNSNQQHGLDIGREQIGWVYGKALLGTTNQAGNTLDVLAEFESLMQEVLHQFPDFDDVLSTPRVSVADKILLLDKVFASQMSEQLLTFLKVVCQHERLDCLSQICVAARCLDSEARGLMEITVSSAEPLAGEVAQRVEQRVKNTVGSEITVTYQVDPNLLGGIVVRAGDLVFDGSVANRLQQLRGETLARSFQATIGALEKFTKPDDSE